MKYKIVFILLFSSFAVRAQMVFSPRTMALQEKQEYKYRPKSAILPAMFGTMAGVLPDNETGKNLRNVCIFGAAVSISFGEKKPLRHYLINTGVSAVAFLAGRGIREINGQ